MFGLHECFIRKTYCLLNFCLFILFGLQRRQALRFTILLKCTRYLHSFSLAVCFGHLHNYFMHYHTHWARSYKVPK